MLFDTETIDDMIATLGDDETVEIDSPGLSLTLGAIVNIGSRNVQMGDGEIATLAPSVTVATYRIEETMDAGEVGVRGSVVTVRGVTYRCVDHQPDGEGFSVLILARED